MLAMLLALVALAPTDHALGGRALVRLEPAAVSDDDARARVEVDGARFLRRSVLGWVEIGVADAGAHVGRLRAVGREAALVRRALPLGGSSDPKAGEQRLEVIHATDAWEMTIGNGQRIGIVDTGLVRDHEDIAAVDADGWDFISDPEVAADGDGRDADYREVFGAVNELTLAHGTHVAGTIAAPGDNSVGIAGLNWNTAVVSARAITADAGGISTDILEAALWLAGGDIEGVPPIEPVDVINMSLGIVGACDEYTQSIVDEILARGVVIVAAVGNHGDDFGTNDDAVLAPASCAGVIAVGAVDNDRKQTDYTNDDGRIDIFAPGGTHSEGVLSLGAQPHSYVGQQGTSMATPHVTGVVSLMLEMDPTLTPAAIRSILLALPSTCSGCDGKPMLDAAIALEKTLATDVEAGGGCASTGGAPFIGALALALARRRLTRSCTSRACSRARSS